MKIIQTLKSLVEGEKQVKMNLNLLRGKKEISAALSECKANGKVIGIYSDALGQGMFLAGVEEIHRYGEREVITFKRHDLSGALLPKYEMSLEEIRRACPFDTPYINPMTRLKIHYAA